MITTKATYWLDTEGIKKAVEKAVNDPLHKAAMLVRDDAKKSMHSGFRFTKMRGVRGRFSGILGTYYEPSRPGTPPNVRTGNLRSSIKTAQTRLKSWVVVIDARAWYGIVHEFGGRHHPPRPFLRPALARVYRRFPQLFKGLRLKSYYKDITASMRGRLAARTAGGQFARRAR